MKKLPVRAVERIARSIAQDRVRRSYYRKTQALIAMEKSLAEALGTRVIIEAGAEGGRLTIDFFSKEDLAAIAQMLEARANGGPAREGRVLAGTAGTTPVPPPIFPNTTQIDEPADLVVRAEEDDIYSVTDFTV
jgi:histone H3/H4